MLKEILVAVDPRNAWSDRLKDGSFEGLSFSFASNGTSFFDQYFVKAYDAYGISQSAFDVEAREMIQRIRRLYDIPIILFADEASSIDVSIYLGLGADEYVSLSDDNVVVNARLHALLRRNEVVSNKNQWLAINDTRINLVTREVIRDDERFTLPKKIYELLKLFVENPQRIITKEDIYMTIWHERSYFSEANINVYIRRLRQAIESDPANPQLIVTVWGQGYRFSGSIREGV
jgi:DNA-binding response OmpR family regulator